MDSNNNKQQSGKLNTKIVFERNSFNITDINDLDNPEFTQLVEQWIDKKGKSLDKSIKRKTKRR